MSKLNELFGIRVGFQINKENLQNFATTDQEENSISEVNQKISKVVAIYPKFNPIDFLTKAQKAFEIIFQAYANEDLHTLKDFLSPKIFHAFSMAIEDRKVRKEVLEGILIRIISSEIIDSDSVNDDVFVTVKFATEQSNVLKSKNGEVIEGNSDFIETRTDTWSFVRKKSSTSSKWYLYEIKSEG
jgi:predicted lipid-binding transport protein (Tim44 family)